MNRSLKISQVAIASVAHQGACWTWNLRAWDLFPLRVTFLSLDVFYFHKVNTKMPQLAFPYSLWKTRLFVRLHLLISLHSRALLILAKSSKFKSLLMYQEEYQTGMEAVSSSIPSRGNFLLDSWLLCPHNPSMSILPILCISKKNFNICHIFPICDMA